VARSSKFLGRILPPMRTGKRQVSLPRSPQSRRRGVSVETRAGECFTIPKSCAPGLRAALGEMLPRLLEKNCVLPSFECLSLCVSLAQREFGSSGRDCRTTKMRERDARAVIAANAAQIRLCVKTVVARLAQSPGTGGRICKAEKPKITAARLPQGEPQRDRRRSHQTRYGA